MLRHEHERTGAVAPIPRFFPGLPDPVQQKTNILVRHAVSDEQNGIGQGVRPEPDVQRGRKRESIEKVGLSHDERCVVVQIAVVFDDMCNADRRAGDLPCIADLSSNPLKN